MVCNYWNADVLTFRITVGDQPICQSRSIIENGSESAHRIGYNAGMKAVWRGKQCQLFFTALQRNRKRTFLSYLSRSTVSHRSAIPLLSMTAMQNTNIAAWTKSFSCSCRIWLFD